MESINIEYCINKNKKQELIFHYCSLNITILNMAPYKQSYPFVVWLYGVSH